MRTRRVLRLSTLLLVLALGASTAHAQRSPDQATLDRGDGISRIGLDLAFTSLESPPYDSALRFDLFGQYVTSSGLGFYGSLPLAVSFGIDDLDGGALGNVDLGLLYIMSTPAVSWVLRGGVALPTADDDVPGALTNFYATWPRLTDYALTVPDAVYVRAAVSPLIHVSNIFLRLDLGVDLAVHEGDVYEADSLFRFNVAAGVDLGPVALALELVNLASFEDFNDDDPNDEEDFLHTAALSLRFMNEAVQPFLAVGMPLDDFVRDRIDFFVSAGLQAILR